MDQTELLRITNAIWESFERAQNVGNSTVQLREALGIIAKLDNGGVSSRAKAILESNP